MHKVASLFVVALLFVFIAGHNFEKTAFSGSFWIQLIMAVGILFWAAFELVCWNEKGNEKSRILQALDPRKWYRLIGREMVGDRCVWSLYDLQAKQFRIMITISTVAQDGFKEISQDSDIFLIPDGKKLAKGKSTDFVFVE